MEIKIEIIDNGCILTDSFYCTNKFYKTETKAIKAGTRIMNRWRDE